MIDSARAAGLVSLGGQLQFRLAGTGTLECYWVDVSTEAAAPVSMPWPERVVRAAEAGLEQFRTLFAKVDFLAEGRRVLAEDKGPEDLPDASLAEAMCFVWYVSAPRAG